MSADVRPQDKAGRLGAAARSLWSAAEQRFPASELDRLRVFFECVARGRGPGDDTRRALHARLWLPGLTPRPWWDPAAFPLARRLESKYEMIRGEAEALLGKPHAFRSLPGRSAFGAPGAGSSPLEGHWRGYYLHQHMRLVREAAEHVPITLRALDDVPCAREAMVSFLGSASRITRHSDKVNFVVTMYLPLFASGAWMELGGESHTWVDGKCAVADSTFFHESSNGGAHWRGLLIIDMWHPELTSVERAVLTTAVPVVNDILREGSIN